MNDAAVQPSYQCSRFRALVNGRERCVLDRGHEGEHEFGLEAFAAKVARDVARTPPPPDAATLALNLEDRVRQCIADLKASAKEPRAVRRTDAGSLDLHLLAIYRLDLAAEALVQLAAACNGWPVHEVTTRDAQCLVTR